MYLLQSLQKVVPGMKEKEWKEPTHERFPYAKGKALHIPPSVAPPCMHECIAPASLTASSCIELALDIPSNIIISL